MNKSSKKAATSVSITHMSNLHNDCLRALDFYKQEISILKERLTEIGFLKALLWPAFLVYEALKSLHA